VLAHRRRNAQSTWDALSFVAALALAYDKGAKSLESIWRLGKARGFFR
jgi:hypothetical protein